jgi:hypothetical protein
VGVAALAAAVWFTAAAAGPERTIGWAVATAFALFLLGRIRAARAHGRATLTMLDDELRLRLPFPFPHGPNVPWRDIERFRLSQLLEQERRFRFLTPPKRLFLDVIVRGRPRIRVALAPEHAHWIYEELRARAPGRSA